jgi:SAM-dependent methyltransferase
MLDLLSRSGIDAMGVDIDPAMVQRAKGKGHQVIQQDAVEYLAAQPSASLGAVFAAQVIEHLQPDALLRLLLEAQRALRPGGVLILETVNPYSIQAFKAFWTDLTHRNPIYPEALTVYCAEAGFQEALVMFPNGSGDLASDRWTEGEYAVVARKKT